MLRAEELVAKIWNRVQSGILQREGVLEDALAAALETPGVWERLHRHLNLSNDVPSTLPIVSTQDVVEEGRTDITLRWPNEYSLNLELKVDDPPGKGQIERYLRSGSDVIAIARLPGHRAVQELDGRRHLGVVTWSHLRNLEWNDAPLEWRQFLHLLDAMGVVVKKVEYTELEGLVRSWTTRDKLEDWSKRGMLAVQQLIEKEKLPWACKDKAGQRVKVDASHQRLVWWISHLPWQDDALAIYAGFFVGRVREGKPDPVLEGNLPDLMLSFHLNPESPRGRRVRGDADLQKAIEKWTSRAATGSVVREPRLDGSTWEIIRCRESSRILLEAPDPGVKVVEWMEQRTKEWIDDGIVHRITELAKVA